MRKKDDRLLCDGFFIHASPIKVNKFDLHIRFDDYFSASIDGFKTEEKAREHFKNNYRKRRKK